MLLVALTTSWAFASWRKAAHTLALEEHVPLRFWKPDSSDEGKWFWKSSSYWISAALVLLAGIAWYVRYFGMP